MNDYYAYNMYDYNKEFSSLIAEIESNNCSSIANIVRKLRHLEISSSSESSQVLTKFSRYLDSEISIRDNEIEKFCGTYYQNFVDSIKELMKIQQEATDLKQSCTEVKKELSDSVKRVTHDCTELSKTYSILNNIDNAIENLENCLPVFDQYLKAEKCIKEKRYYPALKALNHLELNQMTRVNKFAFSETLQNEIPEMREKIKSASKDEIKDFLETVRKHSSRLGKCTMKQVAEKNGMVLEGLEYTGVLGNQSLENSLPLGNGVKIGVNSGKSYSHLEEAKLSGIIISPESMEEELKELVSTDRTSLGSWYVDDNAANDDENQDKQLAMISDIEITNVEDLVDFGPVYRCLHIHSVLGNRHEFEKCYRNQRKRQCTLLLTLTKQETIRNYCDFFSGIVGFFVVEDYIRYSEMSIVTRNYLDELWSHTLSRIGDFIQANSKNIDSIDILLDLKNYCLLFGKTMRSLGFNVAGFKDFYEILRNRYQNLLADDYNRKFKAIFDGEDYTAITVSDANDMELVIELYPSFLSPDIDLQPYPKTLSFSWMVPRIYQLVKEHIKKSKQFADNLELSQTELEDQLNHTTNKLFELILNPLLLKAIKDSNRQINRLVQLAVNMDELESACNSIQHFIQSLVGIVYTHQDLQNSLSNQKTSPGQMNARSRLHAFATFKDLHGKIEDSIYNAIFAKIDDIFDENEYIELNSINNSLPDSGKNSPSKKINSIADSIAARKLLEASISSIKPSEFISDIIVYLNTTFESFTNLPVRIAQTVCFLCCNHINEKLQLFIKKEPRISEKLLRQMSADVHALEEFTKQIPVAGISPEQLLMKFEDLRQLIDLVLLGDWSTYLANYNTKNNPYDRVAPQYAIQALEKCRQTDTKLGAFLKTIKKNKQEKKEDEIIRQLKELR